MAMRYCSKWNSSQHIKPELTSFLQAEPEPPGELLDHYFNFNVPDCSLDQLLEPSNELLVSESHDDVLQYLNLPPDSLKSDLPDTLPAVMDFDPWDGPKRQKINEIQFSYLDSSPAFLNDCVLNFCPPLEPFPELLPSLPEFPIPPTFTFGNAENLQKPDSGLSPQSVAARQRRRKIADKLQELGKLVPGGTKMNTAEMLQSAFKYVKFLQAEVGIMELIGSSQEAEKSGIEELQFLLPSPVVQEKLYSKEKCLVPQEFVQKVADDHMLECKPSVATEIGRMTREHNSPSKREPEFFD